MTWTQVYDPLGHWWLSTIVAALPIIVLLGLLAGLRVRPHIAAISGAVTALLISHVIFGMPWKLSAMSFTYGLSFGLLKIVWIVVAAVYLYELTVHTGHFEIMKNSLANVTSDRRLQTLMVAFCFGAFLEGCAGFSTPVAIASAFMVGLGFSPFHAAVLNLIANTSPVAWGAIGTPVHTLAAVSGLPESDLNAMIGRILPITCIIVPFWLVRAVVGWKETFEVTPAILVVGISFGSMQFLWANHVDSNLVDIMAGVFSLVVTTAFLLFWKPKTIWRFPHERAAFSEEIKPGGNPGLKVLLPMVALVIALITLKLAFPSFGGWHVTNLITKVINLILKLGIYLIAAVFIACAVKVFQSGKKALWINLVWVTLLAVVVTVVLLVAGIKVNANIVSLGLMCLAAVMAASTFGKIFEAWIPFVILSLMVLLWGLPTIKKTLNQYTTPAFSRGGWDFPVVHRAISRDKPVVAKPTPENAKYDFNWFTATGSACFLAALLSGLVLCIRPGEMFRVFGRTLYKLRFAIIAIGSMLGLGYLTRYSGMDAVLGLAFTRTGWLFPIFGTFLGWLGVALTGSDTSSNALFGSLQRITSERLGLNPVLMCAANSAGGVMGKMVDAQSITVATAATNTVGTEGSIFRHVFWHSVALALIVGLIVLMYARMFPQAIPHGLTFVK